MTVTPGAVRLVIDQTAQMAAEVRDQRGQIMTGVAISWSSSDGAVAVVDSTGLVRGVGEGTASVTASTGGVSGTAAITVAESADRRTLKALYEATAGANWTNGDNWLTSVPVGEWHGVEVDTAGRVVLLDLGGNNLTGSIPPDVGDLDRLRVLHLDDNELNGPLPAELAGATGLTVLRINGNPLTGPLPRSILALSLYEFHYADTGLCVPPYETFRDWLGGIAYHAGTDVECAPPSDREILVQLYGATDGPNWENSANWLTGAPLGEWHGVTTDADGRVRRLELRANGLEGVLPAALGGLSQLRRLTLVANRLAGPIPPELGQLRQLDWLSLGSNALVGVIPPELGNASILRVLSLSNNRLRGAVPGELGQLTALEALSLDLNNLSGALPTELGNLSRLQFFELHRNILQGPIPASLLGLELEQFTFEDNLGLCAPGTAGFVAWLEGIAEARGGYCNADDTAVLERLYEATEGAGWTRSDGWLSGQPLGGWHGVVTDSLGYVRELDLSGNGLVGTLPSDLGDLAGLTSLRIGGNALTGPLPLSFTQLRLSEFRYSGTELCVPSEGGVSEWLNTVSSHDGTGLECAVRDDRAVLETLYRSLDGPNWTNREGWLTDRPLDSWSGVRVDGDGRVIELSLSSNNLSGRIPAELGNLSRLRSLHLSGNALGGPIPAAIGGLSRLERLNLSFNPLDAEIPAELGNLSDLRYLRLDATSLRGSIPAELGGLDKLEELILNDNRLTGGIPLELGHLSNLRRLILYGNALTGRVPSSLGNLSQLELLSLRSNGLSGGLPPTLGKLRRLERLTLDWNPVGGRIPRELGSLGNLKELSLRGNLLTGRIPRELGALSRLEVLNLAENDLTGVIPAEIGNLSRLEWLRLERNRLSGSIPPELGGLASLQYLNLTYNRDMEGVLPTTLTALGQLETFLLADTKLCAPRESAFLDWLGGVDNQHVTRCGAVEGSVAYVTQAVQSVDFPVPLVAGDDGLLRVFVRADESTGAGLPPVRASFFLNGAETHVVDIPAQSASIPVELEEGDLGRTANARIPGSLLQPGLEMVVEIDPDGTLDPALGITARIPETGRAEVNVRAVPAFALTVIPFLAASNPDRSILEFTRDLDAGSDLLRDVNALLPVARLDVNVHEPVFASSIELNSVLRDTEAIRIMEGGSGYYAGLAPRTTSLRGVAHLAGRASASIPVPDVIAHELGHNLNLSHAPCGGAEAPDPSFPQRDGSTGAWGFDFRNEALVPPSAGDLMSYCEPRWISTYNFARMLSYRVSQGDRADGSTAAPTRSLLLWGGVDAAGDLFLDPALVVDAPAVLPGAGGAYRLVGLAADDRELFALNFDLPTVADGDGRASFAFTLPAEPAWSDALARIALSGPEGSATLDRESDRPVAILLDPASGRVRAILRHPGGAALAEAAAAEAARAAGGLEVLYSRGIPGAAAWRR